MKTMDGSPPEVLPTDDSSEDSSSELGSISKNPGLSDPFLLEAFQAADSNGDGKLSSKEVKSLLKSLGLDMSDDNLDEWVTNAIQDGGESFDFNRFMSIFNKKEKVTLEKYLKETFDLYSVNGTIDKEELSMMMAQLGHDADEQQLNDMISVVDHEGKGGIDFEDFAKLFKGVTLSETNKKLKTKSSSSYSIASIQSRTESILGGSIFDDAKEFITMGPFFRNVMRLYSERKVNLAFGAHFVANLVIFTHFAYGRFHVVKERVDEGSDLYWVNIIIPTMEFGSMHCVLFNLAIVPFTMARYSIASFATSFLNDYFPLDKTQQIHNYLGYLTTGIISTSSVTFFVQFGLQCSHGVQSGCDMFTSEIMITGYIVLVLIWLMAVSAYFRYKIRYEVFIAIHFMFLALYALTIAHTLDAAVRNGKFDRSQTFKWFFPLMYYFCDYGTMYFNSRYNTKVHSFTAVEDRGGSKMIILKLIRPALFQFEPGQYAFLRVSGIDRAWHPFSIASEPKSDTVEFYVDVFGKGSWTEQLWTKLKNQGNRESISIDIMGPYGTPLIKKSTYTHVVAVGAGTGIVPITSLLRQHVGNMLTMDRDNFLVSLKENEKRSIRIRAATEHKQGSFFSRLLSSFRSRADDTLSKASRRERKIQSRMMALNQTPQTRAQIAEAKARLKIAVFEANKGIYGRIIHMVMALFGIAVLGLCLSFTLTGVEVSSSVTTRLQITTLVFHGIFFISAFVVWDAGSLSAYLDAAVGFLVVFADWYFARVYGREGSLNHAQVILLSMFNAYMALRYYQKGLASIGHQSSSETVEHLSFVWTVRSVKVARQIYPEINKVYEELVNEWGTLYASEVLKITIHITTNDTSEASQFRKEIRNSSLYKSRQVLFIRPKFQKMLEDHATHLIDYRPSYSSTLVAFCGSRALSGVLSEARSTVELLCAATGNRNHVFDYVSECYGGPKHGMGKSNNSVSKVTRSSAALWDAVRQETAAAVNMRRVNVVFKEDDEDEEMFTETDGLLGKEFTTNRELIEEYRQTGAILRHRRPRSKVESATEVPSLI